MKKPFIVGINWIIKFWGGGGRAKSIMCIRNFNLRGNQVRKTREISINGSLIYTHKHHFPQSHPNFF